MLFLTRNSILTQNREKTYLTASVAAAGTTLTVKAVDTNAWADNDWIIVGEIGTPTAEVLQINGAVSDGTSLTIDNAGSGGARFAHSPNEPVYRIDYNQIKVYRATTATGAKTNLTTIELQPDNFETRYEDTSNTTGFGFVTFYNSLTTAESPYSDAIPYAGQALNSLSRMITKVRNLLNEDEDDFVTDADIVDALNEKQRDILNERLWTFNEIELSTSSVENQFEYEKPELIKTFHTIRFKTEPLAHISEAQWEMFHYKTDNSSDRATHVAQWNNKIRVYPRPSGSATASTLDGNITASDTSIDVVDATSFDRGDYYRFIINDEVIYATGLSTNTFTGCLRGQEGTTAASHTSGDTVTERDIVYTGQKIPIDLEAQNDETVIPEGLVLCYGAASDLAYGKLDKPALGDRYLARYDTKMNELGNRFTLKLTSQFGRIKDPRELIQDNSQVRDPNWYPQNVQAS